MNNWIKKRAGREDGGAKNERKKKEKNFFRSRHRSFLLP
jgi:hypothetical protein